MTVNPFEQLTRDQWDVLDTLQATHHPLTAKAILEETGVQSGNVYYATRRLVHHGLAQLVGGSPKRWRATELGRSQKWSDSQPDAAAASAPAPAPALTTAAPHAVAAEVADLAAELAEIGDHVGAGDDDTVVDVVRRLVQDRHRAAEALEGFGGAPDADLLGPATRAHDALVAALARVEHLQAALEEVSQPRPRLRDRVVGRLLALVTGGRHA